MHKTIYLFCIRYFLFCEPSQTVRINNTTSYEKNKMKTFRHQEID